MFLSTRIPGTSFSLSLYKLATLARLSRMLREKEFKNSLFMASDAEILYKTIIEKDENLSS